MRRVVIAALSMFLVLSGLVVNPASATDGAFNPATGNGDVACDSGSFTVSHFKVTTNTECEGTVTIPSGVTSIGPFAFAWSSVTDVQFSEPSVVTRIEQGAFFGSRLASAEIPSSVTEIGFVAFVGTVLARLRFLGDEPRSTRYSYGIQSSGPTVAHVSQDASGFATVDSKWNGLTIVVIGGDYPCGTAGTFTVSHFAVTGNSSCQGTVLIPEGVASISDDAFRQSFDLVGAPADGITNVTFEEPQSVVSIGENAFAGSSITSISIPNSVTSIGDGAFFYTVKLATVTFDPNSRLVAIGNATFSASVITEIDVPTSVESIGNAAFSFTASLQHITFDKPTKITSIASHAFTNSGLLAIEIPATVETLGEGAFQGDAALSQVTFEQSTGLTKISKWAFQGTAITSIAIPASVTTNGDAAFSNCHLLTSVTFDQPAALQSIGSGAFIGTVLSTIEVPAHVTSIRSSAFQGVSTLVTIVFLGNAPTMGANVFHQNFIDAHVYKSASATGYVAPGGSWQSLPISIGGFATSGLQLDGKAVASRLNVSVVSPKAVVTTTVDSASSTAQVCAKVGLKVSLLKAGLCTVNVKVQEPKPKRGAKPKATVITATFIVQ